jgi:hypothetical protein
MQERLVLFACSVQILHQPLEPRAIERLEHSPNVDPGWQRTLLFGHEHQPSGGDWEVRFLCWLNINHLLKWAASEGSGGRKFNDRPRKRTVVIPGNRGVSPWEHIYRVIPYPRYDGEYEITNWYTGTHPDAPYQSNIIAARPGSDRTQITMFNARVTVRHATGEAERRHLSNESEFRSVLRDEFGLNMTDAEIRTCIDVMQRKGEKGAPHPFFA